MPVLAPPRASAAVRPAGGNALRGLPPPPRPAGAAPAAANKIVRFLRTSGLPAPAASQLAPLAAGLAEMGRRLVSFVPVAGAVAGAFAPLLLLGGDSAQRAKPATDLLPRLTRKIYSRKVFWRKKNYSDKHSRWHFSQFSCAFGESSAHAG
jgi:hypothetical protein